MDTNGFDYFSALEEFDLGILDLAQPYSSLDPETFAQETARAAETFNVIFGDDFTLLLDVDTQEQQQTFARELPRVNEYFPIKSIVWWASKSGNRHFQIIMDQPLSVTTRIYFQKRLGSDPVLEDLRLERYDNGVKEPNRLFQPKDAEIIKYPLPEVSL